MVGFSEFEREARAMIRDVENDGRYRGLGYLTASSTLEQVLASCAMSAAIVTFGAPPIFLGIAQLGALDLRHGTAQLMGCLTAEAQAQGWPAGGFIQFIERAFDTHPLRKLYCEVNAKNFDVFGSGLGRFVTHEATLRDHEWCQGEYVDTHFFSVTREQFNSSWWGRGPLTRVHESPLLQLVQEVIGVSIEGLDDSCSMADLGCDSLTLLEAVLSVEVAIGRELPL